MTWTEFSGTERFEVLSRLGSGGMGVVYEVFDRERHARVALKQLRTPSPEALLRFKKEFRALEKVQHPNLVMLGELIEDGGEWFFTMELVDGVDFLAYVRPDGVLDVDRLRDALRQLAGAVAALHAAGKVHRDIKPANIIVERSGRLALIDLGLVLELDSHSIPDRDAVAGTANYMAPEQAVASNRVGPEADWYSVGAVLFHALTGQLPFDGTPLQVMLAKQQHPAPPADGLIPGLPGDLVLLADQLLAIDPDARPGDTDIVQRLGVALGSHPSASGATIPFVGRSLELAALLASFERTARGPVSVLVRGHSGVGKTSLVQRFLTRLDATPAEEQRVLVLGGRCHEREMVPFKAVDDVVDGLAKFLGRQPEPAVQLMLPPGARALARVFPVLRQVEAIAIAPSAEVEPADDRERRARVFGAFRELLARVAAYRRLVLVIDDLQWADADSAVLLRELLRGPDAPRMLLVATVRTGGDAPPVLDLPSEVDTIELAGLPDDDALALARLHTEQLATAAPELAATVAHEAGGHPLFIAELVRYASEHPGRPLARLRLDEAVWARAQSLPAPMRRLLSLIALAGAPLPQGVAARAAEAADFNEYARWVAALRAAFLVRTTGVRAHDRVEPYHDRVRDAVLGRLAPEARTICHRRLAVALEGSPEADPESLAYHWRGAGDPAAAATHALEAARRADQAFAFDHAARLYRSAIDLEAPKGERLAELLARLGDALANAGRGADAGHVYLEAARAAHQSVALELKRRAAEQLLRTGHIADGMKVLDRVLEPIGMHLARTPTRALISLGLTRARVRVRGLGFRPRAERDIPREELIRIDTCWAVSIGLALVDPIRASDFQARQLLLALRMGEPYRVCRGLIAEAGYRSVAGGKQEARVEALLARCLALAEELGSDRALALHRMTSGIAAYLMGRWRTSMELSRDAEVRIEQQVGMSWELFNARYYTLLSRYWTGELRTFSQHIPHMLADADEHGDLLAGTTLRNGLVAMAPLLRDDPDRTIRDSNGVVSRLPDQFNFQHYWQMIALTNAGIYARDTEAAFAALEAGWERSRKAMVLRIQYIRVEALWTRARAHLAAAEATTGEPRRRHLTTARDAARRLAREGMAWISPKAALLEAGIADLEGEPERALEHLATAAAGFDAADMSAFAVAARRAHGAALGGEDGDRVMRDADAWLRSQGVTAPARLVALWIPGFSRR